MLGVGSDNDDRSDPVDADLQWLRCGATPTEGERDEL